MLVISSLTLFARMINRIAAIMSYVMERVLYEDQPDQSVSSSDAPGQCL